jgi:hypothetical protein
MAAATSTDAESAPDDSRYVETDLYAEPEPYAPAASPGEDPSIRLRLARIHLRTGSLAIARAEFESLSATDQLDLTGQLDLAEARWRTGEIHGAGDAALAYVSGGGSEPLGFVIAAEDQAFGSHPAESKRYLEEALDRSVNGVESLFAGITPRAAWPAAQPLVAEPSPPTSIPEPQTANVEPEVPVESSSAVEPPAVVEPAPEPEPAVQPAPEPAPEPAGPPAPEPESVAPSPAPMPDPWQSELAAGADALASNDPLMAALHLAMALRVSPAAAGAVLESIGERRDLALELVRGEALRALGQEGEAGRTDRSVASAIASAAAPTIGSTDELPPPAEPTPQQPRQPESAPDVPPGDDMPKINWGD